MSNPYEDYKDLIIFEDDLAFAVHLKSDANSIGHIRIYPKQAITNLEDMSESDYVRLFTMASLAATLIWENAYNDEGRGTNIMMHSGVDAIGASDRGYFECILREPNDGLNTKWEHKEPDFSYVDKLKDETFIMSEMEKQGSESKESETNQKEPEKEEPKKEEAIKENSEQKVEAKQPAKQETETVVEEKEEKSEQEEVELKTPTQYYKERISSNQKLRNQERSP